MSEPVSSMTNGSIWEQHRTGITFIVAVFAAIMAFSIFLLVLKWLEEISTGQKQRQQRCPTHNLLLKRPITLQHPHHCRQQDDVEKGVLLNVSMVNGGGKEPIQQKESEAGRRSAITSLLGKLAEVLHVNKPKRVHDGSDNVTVFNVVADSSPGDNCVACT